MTAKGRQELSEDGHLYQGSPFPYEKREKKKLLPYPEGWSTRLGLEEPVQALIPALVAWTKPCSEANGLTVLLSFSLRAGEAARSRVALQRKPV